MGPFKETQWWVPEVKTAVTAKKDTFKLWQTSRSDADFAKYKEMKKQ